MGAVRNRVSGTVEAARRLAKRRVGRPLRRSMFLPYSGRMDVMVLNLSAVAAMVPASLQALRRLPARDTLFWALVGLAATGALVRAGVQLAGPWQTSFAAALWVSIAATSVLFLVIAAVTPQAWRLTPVVSGTLLALGVLATIWQHAPGRPLVAGDADASWVVVHIAVAVATYALVTLAAAAAAAACLQQRALKRKRPTALTRMLPSVSDCDRLVFRLLLLGEGVLAIGVATGLALTWRETGSLVPFDHKTILTLAAFALIGGLLLAHWRTGVRGRQAARYVLVAYLLLTLGYPGVKFVTDVLMT